MKSAESIILQEVSVVKIEVIRNMMPCKFVNSYKDSEVAGCPETSVTTY
jgi:hypothetical protein